MLRRTVGVTISGLMAFGFLVVWDATRFTDPMTAYAVSALVGAAGAVLWPAVIGWWLAGRAKQRRLDRLEADAARQAEAARQSAAEQGD